MSALRSIIDDVISPGAGANSPPVGERETCVRSGFSPRSPVLPFLPPDVHNLGSDCTNDSEAIPYAIEMRVFALLVRGAIDQEDADLVRLRYQAHPHEEWAQLLEWCEGAQ